MWGPSRVRGRGCSLVIAPSGSGLMASLHGSLCPGATCSPPPPPDPPIPTCSTSPFSEHPCASGLMRDFPFRWLTMHRCCSQATEWRALYGHMFPGAGLAHSNRVNANCRRAYAPRSGLTQGRCALQQQRTHDAFRAVMLAQVMLAHSNPSPPALPPRPGRICKASTTPPYGELSLALIQMRSLGWGPWQRKGVVIARPS